jgi:hypothetical protein
VAQETLEIDLVSIRPEDFVRNDGTAPRRLGGTEFEHDVQYDPAAQVPYRFFEDAEENGSVAESGRARSRKLEVMDFITADTARAAGYSALGFHERTSEARVWLGNGDLLYPENNLQEWSSKERIGPKKIAASDISSIIVVPEILSHSQYAEYITGIYRRTGHISADYQDKNGRLVRGRQTTTGHHLNLITTNQIFRTSRQRERLRLLASNLITQVWGWNGLVGKDGYEWSQKWRGMGDTPVTLSLADRINHGAKPTILIRNQSNDDSDVNPDLSLARVEMRHLNGSFSRLGSFLKAGVGSLVMRLIEHWDFLESHGVELSGLHIEEHLGTLERIATSTHLEPKFRLADGREVYADNLQSMQLDAVVKMVEIMGMELPADEAQALEPWARANDAMRFVREGNGLERERLAGLAVTSDAARKLMVLTKRFPGQPLTVHNQRAVFVDTDYDRISTDHEGNPGLGMRIAQQKSFQAIDEEYVPEHMVREAVMSPDANTRSLGRAALVGRPSGNITGLSWSGVQVADCAAYDRRWANPYKPGL